MFEKIINSGIIKCYDKVIHNLPGLMIKYVKFLWSLCPYMNDFFGLPQEASQIIFIQFALGYCVFPR